MQLKFPKSVSSMMAVASNWFSVTFQMLVCKSDDESSDEDASAKKPKDKDKKFQWNHGSTHMHQVHFVGSTFVG